MNKQEPWWKSTVVYQIYPRSFQDSTGNGTGDILGIINRLDYLEELGIGAIWLSPVCKSPQDDNGYDISDYQDIDPLFGTLEDMDKLIAEAKKRDIRILLDLVLNHTSDEHRWFLEAKKGKDNPYHDYYVWRDGEEGTMPNDMGSVFGGPAWEWVPELQQYYFHQFSRRQPDLNWDNPKVRAELYQMIIWWRQRGIGGFRMDVIDQVAKEPDKKITNNGPKLHEYLQEMAREAFENDQDLLTVGEAWGANTEIAKLYSNPDGSEFSMVFQFEHIGLDQQEGKEKWDVAPLQLSDLKRVLGKWQTELFGQGWNSLFWDNHDLPRIVSRWGNDGEYRIESAKMLATLLHGLQGTPYIYQGEELGMTNVKYELEDYQDIETLNMYQGRIASGYTKDEIMRSIYAKGRDNARTPMQWSAEDNAGFTTGKPWLKVNPNYIQINAKQQMADENSIFHYYKKLVALRKEYEVFRSGRYVPLLAESEEIFAYARKITEQQLVVICNFYEKQKTFELPEEYRGEKTVLLSNYDKVQKENELQPYEARIYLM